MTKQMKVYAGVSAFGSIGLHCVAYASLMSSPRPTPISGGSISVEFSQLLNESDGSETTENPKDRSDKAHDEIPSSAEVHSLEKKEVKLSELTPHKASRKEILSKPKLQPLRSMKDQISKPDSIKISHPVSDIQTDELSLSPETLKKAHYQTAPIFEPVINQPMVTENPQLGTTKSNTLSHLSPSVQTRTQPTNFQPSILNAGTKPSYSKAPTPAAPPVKTAAFGFDANAPVNNEASAQYGALVMKHLLRRKKPRAVQEGTTLVEFELNRYGSIKTIQVTKTSGSKRFDREAMRYVNRAAPFPTPPQSVKLNFNVRIKGR